MYAMMTRFATTAAEIAALVIPRAAYQKAGADAENNISGDTRFFSLLDLPPQIYLRERKYVEMGPATIRTVKTPSFMIASFANPPLNGTAGGLATALRQKVRSESESH